MGKLIDIKPINTSLQDVRPINSKLEDIKPTSGSLDRITVDQVFSVTVAAGQYMGSPPGLTYPTSFTVNSPVTGP